MLRTFDTRMLMAQRQGKTSFYMQHMSEGFLEAGLAALGHPIHI